MSCLPLPLARAEGHSLSQRHVPRSALLRRLLGMAVETWINLVYPPGAKQGAPVLAKGHGVARDDKEISIWGQRWFWVQPGSSHSRRGAEDASSPAEQQLDTGVTPSQPGSPPKTRPHRGHALRAGPALAFGAGCNSAPCECRHRLAARRTARCGAGRAVSPHLGDQQLAGRGPRKPRSERG